MQGWPAATCSVSTLRPASSTAIRPSSFSLRWRSLFIKAYYGSAPQYSYGVGCSNGGRHGFVAASRLGKEYDGILAGAPGFDLPKAAIQHALDIQQLHAINGDVRKALTIADQQIVAQRIVAACDKLDGLEDGIVSDTAACQKAFKPQEMICQPGQNSSCLPAEKVKAWRRCWPAQELER